MINTNQLPVELIDDTAWHDAERWAGRVPASFRSEQTCRAYRGDLGCQFTYCAAHGLHPYHAVRRTHFEVYLRDLEQRRPTPSHATLFRRIATLSSGTAGWKTKTFTPATLPRASVGQRAIPAPNRG